MIRYNHKSDGQIINKRNTKDIASQQRRPRTHDSGSQPYYLLESLSFYSYNRILLNKCSGLSSRPEYLRYIDIFSIIFVVFLTKLRILLPHRDRFRQNYLYTTDLQYLYLILQIPTAYILCPPDHHLLCA